jgi:hypothetical protein
MGQAFDRNGNILGELEANSMREVLDGLQKMHPNAAEIRIKQQLEEEAQRLRDPLDRIDDRQEERFIAQDRMLQFFVYAHLPPHLQEVSRPFRDLAATIVNKLPSNPERTVALRKLLEAKDCAVRALLYK